MQHCLGVGVSLGVPGLLLAFMLGFVGSLYGTLTHYGHGPAPVFFGSGYVDLKSWWVKGLITGLVNAAYLHGNRWIMAMTYWLFLKLNSNSGRK